MQIEEIRNLFPGLEEPLYEAILQNAQIIHFTAGSILMKHGDTIRSTMLIAGGVVKLYREDEKGNEFFIYNLEAGQACSLSMVCAIRHETSEVLAIALTDTVILSIPLDFMEKWMTQYPSWYRFVISSYRNRFEELLKTIDAIAFHKMDDRLLHYLRTQVAQMGNPLKITHQQIADDLNSSREVVSRLLKKMEENKMLRLERNSIYLNP